MKKVWYIGFFCDEKGIEENRYVVPSALNKMSYIIESLSPNYSVNILSPAWSTSNKLSFKRRRKEKINTGVRLELIPYITSPFKVTSLFMRLFALAWITINVLKRVRNNDIVILYHSPFYCKLFVLLKRWKRFTLVLEMEEVYNGIFKKSPILYKAEMRIAEASDAFIFSNDLLPKNYGLNKPYVTAYGSYTVQREINKSTSVNNKVNIVYAGAIDKIRLGAFQSLEVAEYLDDKYEMHILGYGDEESVQSLTRRIIEINKSRGYNHVSYHGVLTGHALSNFLNNCDVAINPQINDENMMNAFPSKVLSYLQHSLRVVSTKLDCLVYSEVNELLIYADTPKEMALKIKEINYDTNFDSISVIKRLDILFKERLNDLLDSQS